MPATDLPGLSADRDPAVTVMPLSGLGKALGYRVPSALRGRVTPGTLVRMPVQRRTELGLVIANEAPDDYPQDRLRYILNLPQEYPALSPDLIELARWMHAYYATTFASVLETMIPAAVRKGMRPKQHRLLKLAKPVTSEEMEKLTKRAPRQAELLRFLKQQTQPVPRNTLLDRMKMTASVCDSLVEKGWVEEVQEILQRDAYLDELTAAETVSSAAFELNEEQAMAVKSLHDSLEAAEFAVHLLHGVTGSGKTEVYLRALQTVAERGGGAIFLVPEVALAPQTVARVRSRLDALGVKVVVWHSHLSEGERLDAWRALAAGEARIVVGARSAIFAPVQNLKLIVVDEEHEPSYKQGEVPRYHGRDVAVYRARINDALCVLGSATPSLESLYNARSEKYRLDRLNQRVDDRQLPTVHVVNMTREGSPDKGPPMISDLLAEKLRARFEVKEQTILFINRRGYSTSMLCPDCGFLATCDHCSVPLVYHRPEQVLRCHLCAAEKRAPVRCPSCNARDIRWKGFGTQRIEEVVGKIVPGARIVRLDTDALRRKNLFRKVLNDFRKGVIDILVGTQMIAKGLDFPNVTLVGLVDSDLSLHLPDFRAAERTFQLLVQVSGRAGRGDRAGEVVAQSFLPYSAPIQYARQGDFDGFLDEELANRREFNYPPYRRLIHHLFRGTNPEKVQFYAEHFARKVEEALPKLEIRGPAPAPTEKIKDHYRFQIWYFTNNVTALVPRLQELRVAFPMDKEVIDVIDVDPVQVL